MKRRWNDMADIFAKIEKSVDEGRQKIFEIRKVQIEEQGKRRQLVDHVVTLQEKISFAEKLQSATATVVEEELSSAERLRNLTEMHSEEVKQLRNQIKQLEVKCNELSTKEQLAQTRVVCLQNEVEQVKRQLSTSEERSSAGSAAYATAVDRLNRQVELQRQAYERDIVIARQDITLIQKHLVRQSQIHTDEVHRHVRKMTELHDRTRQ